MYLGVVPRGVYLHGKSPAVLVCLLQRCPLHLPHLCQLCACDELPSTSLVHPHAQHFNFMGGSEAFFVVFFLILLLLLRALSASNRALSVAFSFLRRLSVCRNALFSFSAVFARFFNCTLSPRRAVFSARESSKSPFVT